MKVTDKQTIAAIVQHSKNRDTGSPSDAPAPSTADRVSLSPQARELCEARRALAALPDIRPDKVAEIKARIEAGAYTLDPEAIAERIIRDAFPEDD